LRAIIPDDLAAADAMLTLYGKWAADRGWRARTCGSAEGRYRAEAPQAGTQCAGISEAQREAAQSALGMLRDPLHRTVLAVLYVPQARPPGHLMRLAGISSERSREAHAVALARWWAIYKHALKG